MLKLQRGIWVKRWVLKLWLAPSFLIFGARPTWEKNASLVLKAGTFRPKYLFGVWALWPKNVQLTNLFLLKRMVQHFFILAAVASSQVGKPKRRHAVFFRTLMFIWAKSIITTFREWGSCSPSCWPRSIMTMLNFFPFGNGSWPLAILFEITVKTVKVFSCIGQEITYYAVLLQWKHRITSTDEIDTILLFCFSSQY